MRLLPSETRVCFLVTADPVIFPAVFLFFGLYCSNYLPKWRIVLRPATGAGSHRELSCTVCFLVREVGQVAVINIKFAGVTTTRATAREIQRARVYRKFSIPRIQSVPSFSYSSLPRRPTFSSSSSCDSWTWQGQATTKSGPAVGSAHVVAQRRRLPRGFLVAHVLADLHLLLAG